MAPSIVEVLQCRESGGPHRDALAGYEYRRCSQLHLSRHRSIERSSCAGSVTWLALDPLQHRYLVAAAADSSISFFDMQADAQERGVVGELCAVGRNHADAHRYLVSCVVWYPVDTGLAVSGSYDQEVKLWDTNMLACACKFPMDARVNCVAMSPCASTHCLICVAMQSTEVKLCDPASGACTHTLSGHREFVRSCSWSAASGFHLVTGDESGQVRVWDIRTAGCMAVLNQYNTVGGEDAGRNLVEPPRHTHAGGTAMAESRTAMAHDGAVTCIHPTSDGLYWITCGTDSRVRLWCSSTLRNQLVSYADTFNRANRGRKICGTADGRMLYHPSGSAIQVFDVRTGKQLQLLKQGHFDSINCLEHNPLTHELYSGANDALVLVWDAEADEDEDEDESTLLWDARSAAAAVRW